MYLVMIPPIIIGSVLLLSAVPLVLYISMQYVQQRAFYTNLTQTLTLLEHKYLVTEVIDPPATIEGQLLVDILRETHRDMHEHVKHYQLREQDYRDYIEAWVHEIKTPIAASRLMIDNNRNDVTTMIDDELRQIEHYIEQALYYTRSQHANKDYLIKEITLLDVVRSVVKKMHARLFNSILPLTLPASKRTSIAMRSGLNLSSSSSLAMLSNIPLRQIGL